jgi:hypothetical protein
MDVVPWNASFSKVSMDCSRCGPEVRAVRLPSRGKADIRKVQPVEPDSRRMFGSRIGRIVLIALVRRDTGWN